MTPYPRQLSLDLTPLEVSPSSDWCQRWRDGRPRWRHRSEGGFDATQYEAGPIDDRTAKAYVERNHYARTYVASRLRYGLWDRRGALLGVAVLSVPVRREVLTLPFPDLVPFHESLELGRFVLADRAPANSESWFLGQAFRLAGPAGRSRRGQLLRPGRSTRRDRPARLSRDTLASRTRRATRSTPVAAQRAPSSSCPTVGCSTSALSRSSASSSGARVRRAAPAPIRRTSPTGRGTLRVDSSRTPDCRCPAPAPSREPPLPVPTRRSGGQAVCRDSLAEPALPEVDRPPATRAA